MSIMTIRIITLVVLAGLSMWFTKEFLDLVNRKKVTQKGKDNHRFASVFLHIMTGAIIYVFEVHLMSFLIGAAMVFPLALILLTAALVTTILNATHTENAPRKA